MTIRVTVTAGPDRGLRCPLVEQELLLIGRGEQCGLQLADPSVSRMHCRLLLSEGRITLDDVGSRWGVRVNGAAAKGSIPERLQGCMPSVSAADDEFTWKKHQRRQCETQND